jgi:hypothetical protein
MGHPTERDRGSGDTMNHQNLRTILATPFIYPERAVWAVNIARARKVIVRKRQFAVLLIREPL